MTNNKSETKENQSKSSTEDLASKFPLFAQPEKNEIIVPEMAISARNNCQSGRWQVGEEEKGDKLKMLVFHYAKYFGDLGESLDQNWMQLWFVAVEGDLPLNMVYVSYLKTRSLDSFNTTIAEIQTRGFSPATRIIVPSFVKHSGQKPDEDGKLKPINYYSLVFNYEDPKDQIAFEAVCRMLRNPDNHHKLADPVSTKRMVCLEGLNPSQQRQAISAFKMQKYGYVEADFDALRLASVSADRPILPSADLSS